jgi:UDP-glucose 4-epimerase
MILLTGATGYIASHIWVELLCDSFQVVGLDNLSNSRIECLNKIGTITGKVPRFIQGDIRDQKLLERIFDDFSITHVIHLAALKDVAQSTITPDEYFDVNVRGLATLINVMRSRNCSKIVFSSSASVYGESVSSPISEMATPTPSNFYGTTKLEGESLLTEGFNRSPAINSVILRYFNVAGRHPSGVLYDDVSSNSRSLFSEIESVLRGEKEFLPIFGNNWATPDGTCIRDYLHVTDLARGHLDALEYLNKNDDCLVLNLGLGVGQSVSEVISSYEHVVGKLIPKIVAPIRVGDVAKSIADTSLAIKLIGWAPTKTLNDMCLDSFSAIASNQGAEMSSAKVP